MDVSGARPGLSARIAGRWGAAGSRYGSASASPSSDGRIGPAAES